MSTFFPHLLAEAYSEVYHQEEFDPTDMVLDYLIAEGYADDEDEAFDILEQLDGAVIQGIIDEVNGCGGKVDPNTGKYMNGESARMMLSPKKKAEKMAERKEKEATKPDHFRKAAKMKRIAQNMKEEFDTYDLVLDYLLDEGYADTEESALKIMSNMSEEWVDSIIEEAVRGSERSIGNRITGNDIRSVSRGKSFVYKKPNWQDRVETNVRRKMGKEGHRNPYQYGSELTQQARKSAERMNAIKNVEGKHDYNAYNSDDIGIETISNKSLSGYKTVPTDYRARRRRASGR